MLHLLRFRSSAKSNIFASTSTRVMSCPASISTMICVTTNIVVLLRLQFKVHSRLFFGCFGQILKTCPRIVSNELCLFRASGFHLISPARPRVRFGCSIANIGYKQFALARCSRGGGLTTRKRRPRTLVRGDSLPPAIAVSFSWHASSHGEFENITKFLSRFL